MRKTTVTVIKWAVYIVLLFLFFTFQTTFYFIGIFDIRPVLIVSFVVALSMQEREIFAMVFGLLAGFMWDFSAGKIPGFNAAILMLCCVTISLVTMYFMGNNFLNSAMLCAVVMVLQGLLDYLFYYLIWGYVDSHLILIRYILPIALYTAVVTPLFFFLTRWLHRKFESLLER